MLGWLPGQDYLDTGEGRGSSKAPISSTPDPRLSHNVGHGQVRSRQAPSHGCSCSCAQCGAMAMVEPIAYKFWALWIWMQLKWAAWVCLLIWEPRIRLFSLEEATLLCEQVNVFSLLAHIGKAKPRCFMTHAVMQSQLHMTDRILCRFYCSMFCLS